ncbi:UNVERIFIED_CONTAM: hypothetical protein FKN15_041447 [Acipenser sinensis]
MPSAAVMSCIFAHRDQTMHNYQTPYPRGQSYSQVCLGSQTCDIITDPKD